MSARLTAEFRVKALLRRVHDAGGSAMVLAKGDAIAGGILIAAVDRGGETAFHERGLGPDGCTILIAPGPSDSGDAEASAYWQRRRRADPDLWVIELAVPNAERFAAETIAAD